MRLATLCLTLFLMSIGAAQAQQPPATPIHMAALTGDLDAIRGHIAAGTDLDQRDAYGSTALSIAITFGRSEVARALIESGADLAQPDAQGSTPLHLAAFFARESIVEDLLAQGADATARSGSGTSAYDVVAAPVSMDEQTYAQIGASLAPLGLTLDLGRIAAARPEIAAMLRPSPAALRDITYTPAPDGLPVSAPAEEGLDPGLVAELFYDAQSLPTLHGLLVLKNGRLVAEGYFNGATRDDAHIIQSATKSIISALVGQAVAAGCIDSLDQTVADFFSDLPANIDPRKNDITLRQLLQMRSGLPWEETDPALWEDLLKGHTIALFEKIALVTAPGADFNYSNLTANLLAMIAARTCNTDLRDFATETLLDPIGASVGEWWQDPDGYRYPILEMSARGLARFALTYLQGGRFDDEQVVQADWVTASLTPYTTDAWVGLNRANHAGRHLRQLGYGYQWWTAQVGPHPVSFAWGHGGQLAVLVPGHDLAVVTTAEPFWRQHDETSWRHEQEILNLAGKFVSLLPVR